VGGRNACSAALPRVMFKLMRSSRWERKFVLRPLPDCSRALGGAKWGVRCFQGLCGCPCWLCCLLLLQSSCPMAAVTQLSCGSGLILKLLLNFLCALPHAVLVLFMQEAAVPLD
jgi:hypothetical protein